MDFLVLRKWKGSLSPGAGVTTIAQGAVLNSEDYNIPSLLGSGLRALEIHTPLRTILLQGDRGPGDVVAAAVEGLYNAGGVLLFGAASVSQTVATRFLYPGFSNNLAQTALIQVAAIRDGTLRNMEVHVAEPDGNGNEVVYTLRVNEVPTDLSVGLASTGSQGANTTARVEVKKGNRLDLQVTKAQSIGNDPEEVVVSMEYAP